MLFGIALPAWTPVPMQRGVRFLVRTSVPMQRGVPFPVHPGVPVQRGARFPVRPATFLVRPGVPMQHGVQILAPRCAPELRFLMFSVDRIWHASSSLQQRARLTFLSVFEVTVVDGQKISSADVAFRC